MRRRDQGGQGAAYAIFKTLRRVIRCCNSLSRIGSPLIRDLSRTAREIPMPDLSFARSAGGKLMRLLRVNVSDEIEVGAISAGYGGSDVVASGSGIPRETLAKFAFRLPHSGRDPRLHLRRDTQPARSRLSVHLKNKITKYQ